jgi:hypothetical protein
MTPSRADSASTRAFQPLAAILAWVVPGLGHWYLGQRVRALRIASGIAVLILGGLLIGGVDVVDSKEDRLWFIAQMGGGPVVLAIDTLNLKYVKSQPESEAASWRALGHVNSVGTLSIGLAGMMNVVVILDALYPRARGGRRSRRAEDESV